jgi:hypothetical protein
VSARRLTPALRQRSRVPAVVVSVPVEGPATARVVAQTYEEERRVAAELDSRNLARDVTEALAALRSALAARQERGA